MGTGPEFLTLLRALQQGKEAAAVGPLLSEEIASTPDGYYRLLPLHWALSFGASADVVQLLLAAHPEGIQATNQSKGWTVLHYAERLSPGVVRLLLERSPEAAQRRDLSGMLPLHWATEGCSRTGAGAAEDAAEVVRLLAGAYPEGKQLRDDRGCYPYDLALRNDVLKDNAELLASLLVEEAPSPPLAAGTALEDAPQTPEDVALLFPGQGSQYVGMLKDAAALPAVQSMLRQAEDILGYDVLDLCLNGPEDKLQNTLYCQPAMYIAGLAAVEQLRTSNPAAAARPRCVAGLSLGEYTALTVAGVFTFADGLRLVHTRASAMQEAAELRSQAMISCAGIDEAKIETYCAQAVKESGEGEVCQVSNHLFPKGVSIGGTAAAVQRCFELCEGGGAMQVKMLKTGGGFHTPLMDPARAKLAQALADLQPRISSPTCAVYMNVTAQAIGPSTPANVIVELLAKQLTSPVQWTRSMRILAEDCPAKIYECGPQKQLRAMLKRISPQAFQRAEGVEV